MFIWSCHSLYIVIISNWQLTKVILCEWLVFLILYDLSKLWLIIQKVHSRSVFLVYFTYLFHLWKFIYLAYALKTLKINSIYWCRSLHMYVRLSIGVTQIIYYNKYWHRVVLSNVQFCSISIKACEVHASCLPGCKCGRGLMFAILLCLGCQNL